MKKVTTRLLKPFLRTLTLSCFSFSIVTGSLQPSRASTDLSQSIKEVTITLNLQNKKLKEAIITIQKKSGLQFVYNEKAVAPYQVNIAARNKSVEFILKEVLQNTMLAYQEYSGKVIILEKPEKAVAEVAKTVTEEKEKDVVVTGTVKDKANGDPLPGVIVKVKGQTAGISTAVDGKFSIRVAAIGDILVFSYIGYKPIEIKVPATGIVNVSMEAEVGLLSEVVVSGYTSQNRAEFTGSSSHISGDDIASRPVPSFDQALAGQAAGVSITSNGGSLNAPPVFRIRGFNSIQLSSYPLIIIDGVTSFTGDVGGTAENNPLADINPNDIESMEILKDASATAIYGSRAANGVVVISTKKGKKGQAKVNYDGWTGLNTRPNLIEVLGAEDYVMIKNESRVNAGLAPAFFLQTRADGSIIETDWYDKAYQTGLSQNHSMNISGASDATTYFLSLGYSDQEGFMVKNTFDRTSARLNMDHKITNKLTTGANISYSNSFNSNLTSGTNAAFSLNNIARMAMVLPPNLSPYNDDGSYNMVGNSIGYGANTILTGYYNPMPLIEHDQYSSESNTFLGVGYLELELLKGLKVKTNYSINNLNAENRSFSNPYQAGGFANNGSATNSLSKNKRTDWTNTLSYATTILKDHNLSLLAGTQDILTTTNGWGVTRQNVNDRLFETFEAGWATVSGSSGSLGENAFRSFFGNMFYDYQKKYLLSMSFRRDGFSGLSSGNKYGNFGGGSLGWNISEEEFFKSSSFAKTISSLKLRASYGQVGNINIGNFPALSLYGSGNYAGLATTLAPSQNGNPNLKWETSKKTDIGLNISLFSNRITIDADYYNNKIDGMILNAVQAPSKGIPGNSITSNVGSMYNKGFEFSIDATILKSKNFKWTTNFNISTLKNEVTELANNNSDIWSSGLETSNITRVGESIGAIYVVKTTGVNPANGLRVYLSKAGKEVQYNPMGSKWSYLDGSVAPAIDAYADGYVVGNSIPSYFGGFNNTFNYRKLDLMLNFVYSGGNDMYNGTRGTLLDNRFFNNQTDILRRWTTPGQITDIPKLHYNDQYASGSVLMHSANVEDGSYLKLKNVSVGYKIPAKLYSKAKIASMRLYGSATNFILYTKYTGSDPEISANGDSNTQPGRDKNAVPAGKSFTLGLNIGF